MHITYQQILFKSTSVINAHKITIKYVQSRLRLAESSIVILNRDYGVLKNYGLRGWQIFGAADKKIVDPLLETEKF